MRPRVARVWDQRADVTPFNGEISRAGARRRCWTGKTRDHLHGAACHGCLLIAETSCEQRNDWLDRALVVPTIAVSDAAFFP
jgi:hypothetical protein